MMSPDDSELLLRYARVMRHDMKPEPELVGEVDRVLRSRNPAVRCSLLRLNTGDRLVVIDKVLDSTGTYTVYATSAETGECRHYGELLWRRTIEGAREVRP